MNFHPTHRKPLRWRVVMPIVAGVYGFYTWARWLPGLIDQGHPLWWAAVLLFYPVWLIALGYGAVIAAEYLSALIKRGP